MTFTWQPHAYDEAMKAAGRGLEAATIFVQSRVKEILSIPAPRVTFTNKDGGREFRAGFKLKDKAGIATTIYKGGRIVTEKAFKFPGAKKLGPGTPTPFSYMTAPAIPGEPPRKLSGRLRNSIQREMIGGMQLFEGGSLPTVGRVGTNLRTKTGFSYPRWLELKTSHKFMSRVEAEWGPEIAAIVAGAI